MTGAFGSPFHKSNL